MGVVLDLYVVYLIKLVIWAFRMRGSGKWPITTAVVSFIDEQAARPSYPTGRVVYSYDVDGKPLTGRIATLPVVEISAAIHSAVSRKESNHNTTQTRRPKNFCLCDDDQSASA